MNPENPSVGAAPSEVAFHYVYSTNFAELLQRLGASLLVSTYQAGKVAAVRSDTQGQMCALLRDFDQPMGLAGDARRLAIGTRSQMWVLHNDPDIARQFPPAGQHDSCFLPRRSFVTGDILSHEIAWAGDELWVVNTRFSCLCMLHPEYSFVPRWRPPFITALAGDDRCHLNGLALAADERGVLTPRYVTALGETDTVEGWRPNKATGGCLIDVAANTVVVRGLSMPHSPRWHAGRLWLLDSGRGRLVTVEPALGRVEPVAELPGYPRGLDFAGDLAFIGLSRIRERARFGGLPITERLPEPDRKCGVWVVDVRNGQTIAFLEFEKGVEEVFAVQLLPGLRFPTIVGPQKDTNLPEAFVLPKSA